MFKAGLGIQQVKSSPKVNSPYSQVPFFIRDVTAKPHLKMKSRTNPRRPKMLKQNKKRDSIWRKPSSKLVMKIIQRKPCMPMRNFQSKDVFHQKIFKWWVPPATKIRTIANLRSWMNVPAFSPKMALHEPTKFPNMVGGLKLSINDSSRDSVSIKKIGEWSKSTLEPVLAARSEAMLRSSSWDYKSSSLKWKKARCFATKTKGFMLTSRLYASLEAKAPSFPWSTGNVPWSSEKMNQVNLTNLQTLHASHQASREESWMPPTTS